MARKGKNRKKTSARWLSSRWRQGEHKIWLNHLRHKSAIKSDHPLLEDRFDFQYCRLKNARLHSADLSKTDFTYSSFYRANLEQANFNYSNLNHTDFGSAHLNEATLTNCSLRFARFKHARIINSRFDFSECTGCDFSFTDLNGAYFNNVDLSYAKFIKPHNINFNGYPESVYMAEIDESTFQKIESTEIGALFAKEGKIISYYDYDIAISFAGEDRIIAEKIAKILRRKRKRVFYDEFEQSDLWGKNLYDYLSDLYQNRAEYCLMIISKHYADKAWPTLERQSAQARAFAENEGYILPLRLDDTPVKGILPTTGYLSVKKLAIEDIALLLCEKLKASK